MVSKGSCRRLAVGVFIVIPSFASADILLDQPRDDEWAVVSEWRGGGLALQMGDDFQPTALTRITGATFWMTATWANPPLDWGFTVHRSTDKSSFWDFTPEYDWMYAHNDGASELIDLGPWKQDATLRMYEVRFDNLDIILDPAKSLRGTYWFSSVGFPVGNQSKTHWITSGGDEINGEVAWQKTTPWTAPGWRPLQFPDGSYSDFAFRLEGEIIPAPGAFVTMYLIALLPPRRRR